MSELGHLRLVKFDPDDLSVGGILARGHGTRLVNGKDLSMVFSTFFTWVDQCEAFILRRDASPVAVKIDYDRDERFPSELLVSTSSSLGVVEAESILVFRIVVFGVCYDFESRLLAKSESSEEKFDLVVEVPKSLTTFKARRLPRVDISSQPIMAKVKGTSGKIENVLIQEIGLQSIKLDVGSSETSPTEMIFENVRLPLEEVRRDSNSIVYQLRHVDEIAYQEFFFEYIRFRFPHLKNRRNSDLKEVFDLYRSTDYFGEFNSLGSGILELEKRVTETWERFSIPQEANLVSVDKASEQLVGASGCALAFRWRGRSMWSFHQLCAVTRPSLLQNSGDLYKWRAEFVAGMPGDTNASVWFRSRSRWLERIYVKFCSQSTGSSKVFPVKLIIVSKDFFDQVEKSTGVSVKFSQDGMRFFLENETGFAGVNPKYLNVSTLLDNVVLFDQSSLSSDDYQLILMALEQSQGKEIHLTLKDGIDLEGKRYVETHTDRFCIFEKKDLIDFESSVDHTIAVTEKKLERTFA